jgi:hypothetical protein
MTCSNFSDKTPHFPLEDKMLIPVSMIVLGTQLVMTVADGVPKFDIERGCRLDSTQAFDLSTGQNETVKRCVADEQQALTQLQTQWSQFLGPEKAQCTVEANIGGTPSYVDLLTCLQAAKLARQLPK